MTLLEYKKEFEKLSDKYEIYGDLKKSYNECIPYVYASNIKNKKLSFVICNVKWKDQPASSIIEWDKINEFFKKYKQIQQRIINLNKDFI